MVDKFGIKSALNLGRSLTSIPSFLSPPNKYTIKSSLGLGAPHEWQGPIGQEQWRRTSLEVSARRFQFGDLGPGGVPNPYGSSIDAFEPNTEVYVEPPQYDQNQSDNPLLKGYAEAYNKVQEEKYNSELAAAQSMAASTPLAGGSSGGSVSGVPYASLFNAAAQKYGLSAALLAAVARAESGFNPSAVSPAGAQGLMQFMPGTAAGLGVNPWDPASAIDGAARYLRSHLDRFGNINLALAAYNAGPGAVARYGGVPPYTETQNYVNRVLGYMRDYGGGATVSAGASIARTAAPGPVVTGGGAASSIINAAKGLLGRPYVWGGTTAAGVDCSGLVYYAYRAAGINIPRYRAVDYARLGVGVSMADARPGDVVYWDNPNTTTDHVGIYLGNGMVIQAPNSGDVVKISQVWGSPQFRRLVDDPNFGKGIVAGAKEAVDFYKGQPAAQVFQTPVGATLGSGFHVSIASPIQLSSKQQIKMRYQYGA